LTWVENRAILEVWVDFWPLVSVAVFEYPASSMKACPVEDTRVLEDIDALADSWRLSLASYWGFWVALQYPGLYQPFLERVLRFQELRCCVYGLLCGAPSVLVSFVCESDGSHQADLQYQRATKAPSLQQTALHW
jgi:hypothetical protein